MQDRIAELEQDRIAELEQDRIAELEQEQDAYLKATGLNNYELTEDDKHILASKLKNEDGKEPVKESEPLPESRWWKEGREFAIAELFDVITPKKKFNANSLKISDNSKHGHPYIARGSANNGIRGYVQADEKYLNDGKTISFGQDTATVFWQEEPYFTGDKIKVLKPKFNCNTEIAMYAITAISKSFSSFSWGSQSFKVEVIKNRPICLPIQTDDSGKPVIDAGKTYSPKGYIPDWEYMEKYIKATEKEIIKEVVLYKDKVIAKAKEIAGEKEVA